VRAELGYFGCSIGEHRYGVTQARCVHATTWAFLAGAFIDEANRKCQATAEPDPFCLVVVVIFHRWRDLSFVSLGECQVAITYFHNSKRMGRNYRGNITAASLVHF
jgi:hypothetical protein